MSSTLAEFFEGGDHQEIDEPEHNTDIDNLDKAVEDLNKLNHYHNHVNGILSVLEASIENSIPLNTVSKEMLEVAIETLGKRIGIRARSRFVPSLESHPSIATNIALEGIMDHLKDIAKKLIEMIRSIWEKITEFLKKIFNREDHYLAKLKSLEGEVAKLDDSEPKHKQLQLDNVAAESHGAHLEVFMRKIPLGIKGHCNHNTAEEIIKDTSDLIITIREIMVEIVSCMNRLTSGNLKYEDIVNMIEKLVEDIKNKLHRLGLNYKKQKDNKVEYSFGTLIYEQSCILHEYQGKVDEHGIKLLNIHVGLKENPPKNPYIPDTLPKAKMADLLYKCAKLAEQNKQFQKVLPIVDKALKGSLAFLEAKQNTKDNEDRKSMAVSIELIKDLFRFTSGNLPKVQRDTVELYAAVEYYVKSSIGHYK